MQRLNGSRSSRLFLIELILAILFFSVGSAVCVQAFARAHTVSMEARDLAFASSTASSAANVVQHTDGSLEAFRTFYPEAFAEDGGYAVCFDGDFAPCAEADAAYVLHVARGLQGISETADIRVDSAAGENLYALSLRYVRETEAAP